MSLCCPLLHQSHRTRYQKMTSWKTIHRDQYLGSTWPPYSSTTRHLWHRHPNMILAVLGRNLLPSWRSQWPWQPSLRPCVRWGMFPPWLQQMTLVVWPPPISTWSPRSLPQWARPLTWPSRTSTRLPYPLPQWARSSAWSLHSLLGKHTSQLHHLTLGFGKWLC